MGKVVKMHNKKQIMRDQVIVLNGENHEHFDFSLLTVAVIVSKFNHNICQMLEDACVDQLIAGGIKPENITIIHVPGALEIAQTASCYLSSCGDTDALIALGAVVRGDTYHFEIVANESAKRLAQLAMLYDDKAILNGILTTDNEEQAIQRATEKGKYCATAAIDMTVLLSDIVNMAEFDDDDLFS